MKLKAAHNGAIYCIILRSAQSTLHPTRKKAPEIWTSAKDATIRIWDSEVEKERRERRRKRREKTDCVFILPL
jgi:hypothetical protein